MTKTEVTHIIGMVFLFWLVASIVLIGATIATLRPLSDWREHERAIQLLTLTSTVSTVQVRRVRTAFEFKRLATAVVLARALHLYS